MQNRIEELIKICTERVPYYPAGNDGHPEYNIEFNKQKFAELLIKECVSFVDNVEEKFFNARIATDDFIEKNRYAEAEIACQVAKRKIALHFGIKE